jgi:ElaB/YqjD/DUF883 family membrane-anchored ribosome-binding protein
MSNIPQEAQDKINAKLKELSDDFDGYYEDDCKKAAEYGYNLAQEAIEKLNDELDHLGHKFRGQAQTIVAENTKLLNEALIEAHAENARLIGLLEKAEAKNKVLSEMLSLHHEPKKPNF